MDITEPKSISLNEFNQFLLKVITKYEPSLNEDEILSVIDSYIKDSNISFENASLPTSIILDKAKNSPSPKTYINEALIGLFSFQNENITVILAQCLAKLREYKETSLAEQLNRVIFLLGKDHFKVEIDANDIHAIQFMKEYSCDSVNQSKEKDLLIAKNLSLERERKGKRNSLGLKSKFKAKNHVDRSFKRTYSVLPTSVFQSFGLDKDKEKEKDKDKDKDKEIEKGSKKSIIDSSIPICIEEKVESNHLSDNDNDNVSNIDIENDNDNDNDDEKGKEKEREEVQQQQDGEGEVGKEGEENKGRVLPVRFVKCKTDSNQNTQLNSSSSSLPFVIAETKVNIVFDDINFNIFQYAEETGRISALYNISKAILDKYNFFTFINTERFHTFIDKIRIGYDYLIPYHNDLHAADVLQTCHFIINSPATKAELDLTSLDIAGLFIAAIVHDFKHPGLNNTYHMNKRTPIAVRYNDFSILEQLHVSSAFKVLSHPNSNIFCDLSVEEFRIIRKRMVECVLGTDMARHAKALNNLRKKVDHLNQIKESTVSSVCELLVNYIPDENKFDRQQELLTFIIHCADISNTGKIFPICRAWTLLVMNEFFLQGDKEKEEGLPISFLCNRENTQIPKSQVSFISNIAIPCFNTLEMLFPHCQIFIKNQKENIANWELEEKAEKEDREENQ